MLAVLPSQLIERLRSQITRTKTPVPAIFFRVPMPSASPDINPHISAELWRMQTTKRPYFLLTLLRFIYRTRFFWP